MKCPVHRVHMPTTPTKYGPRAACPEDGCTVVGWPGSPTGTPADLETRQLRRQCHDTFDALWKSSGVFKGDTKQSRRAHGYAWMRGVMGTTPQKTHIGMFNADQCRRLLAALDDLVKQAGVPQ